MINKEITKQLTHLGSVSRKKAVELLNQGFDISTVLTLCDPFGKYEIELYENWHRKMSRDIIELRVDPESYAYELSQQLDQKTPQKLIHMAEKRLFQHKKNCHKGRMLEQFKRILETYLERCKNFYKYAYPYFDAFDIEGLKERVKQDEEIFRQIEEDKLFQLQVIKHVRNLQEFERPLPVELMQIALDTKFCYDRKVLDEQAIMVDLTYGYHLDKSLTIKQMCYDFIKHVLLNERPNSILIGFLLKGDWVSQETHDLLMDAYDNIEPSGMGAIVHISVKNLHEQFNLGEKDEKSLILSEKLIIGLMNRYPSHM